MTANDGTPFSLSLLPRPSSFEETGGTVSVTSTWTLNGPPDWCDIAADLLAPGSGIRFRRGGDGTPDTLLTLRQADLPIEHYGLEVSDDGVLMTAGDVSGIMNACMTLRQLMPAWTELPAPPTNQRVSDILRCRIEDGPRFEWRGVHLDPSRHFIPVPWLFSFVERISRLKLNRLHLHLSDDQGWRFEVRRYPRLTEVAASRPHTANPAAAHHDGTPHGGYYTQEQLRSLVAHAKRHGVTIVPELDVPGHTRALLAAYPELGAGTSTEVATTFGIFQEVLSLRQETLDVLQGIFEELLDVFDSPWIHIGGDECPRSEWRQSDEMQQRAAELGLPGGVEDLQHWFTKRLQQWLGDRGRTAIGWDDVLQQGPLPGAIVMAWRGSEFGRAAIDSGHAVVMAPYQTTYFDKCQSDDPREPYGQPEACTWQDVVAWDPTEGIEPETPLLLGIQGQLWSEYIPDTRHLEYMAFPRLAVLADIAWGGPIQQDVDDYRPRLRCAMQRLSTAGINARPLDGPLPWQEGGSGLRRRS